ncbi:phosphatase PAP2 family protein [bacterium]|nr:phosphatase PAP2 family protein [bacterium]
MTSFLRDLEPWRRPYDWYGIVYALTSAWYPWLNPACFEVLADPGPLQNPPGHTLLHLFLAAVFWLLPPIVRRRGGAAGRVVGLVYMPLLFGTFYAQIEYLGVIFRDYGDPFDPVLIDLEAAIFGMQPSLEWSRAWPWPWLLELMQFAYFSYYFFPLIGLLVIWLASGADRPTRWRWSEAYIRDLTAVMLTCYAWYVFVPVWGPKYFDYLGVAGTIASEGLHGLIFTDVMHWIHAQGALHGAAFPSSHVAGSMVAWWWGWKTAPRHRAWLTVLWGLLCLSIVYCRYHYVVDLVAGVAWGALIMALTARLVSPSSSATDAPRPADAP